MPIPELHVRNVTGRYPRVGLIQSDNVEVQVFEVARLYQIRIDDADHPEMWLELVVEVDVSVEPIESRTPTMV